MAEVMHILAWEWVNIALECTATAWVRLPRFPLAVAGVNLVTHPLLMAALARLGRSPGIVLPCEGLVVLVEWALLCVIYHGRAGARPSGRFVFVVSLLMNAASYGTGLLLF